MSMYASREQRELRDRQRQVPPSTRTREGVRSAMLRTEQERKQQIKPLGATTTSRVRTRSTALERSPVTVFLRETGLAQYAELLHESGFDDMETLLDIEDEHMKELGIPPGHMLKLKKRLREFSNDASGARQAVSSVVKVSPGRSLQHSQHFAQPSNTEMTTVQKSWMQVKALGTDVVGEIFYKKFFELEPESKELFPLSVRMRYRDWAADEEESESDPYDSPALRKLWAKVIDAVGSAVAGMHDAGKLVPMLQQLGMRHVGYGLKPHYLETAGKVLVEVLAEGLGDDFTREIENAWVMVFSFMSATMLSGFRAMQDEIRARESQLSLMGITDSGKATPTSTTGSTGRSQFHVQSDARSNAATELEDVDDEDDEDDEERERQDTVGPLPSLLTQRLPGGDELQKHEFC